jgi:hypothetical protein
MVLDSVGVVELSIKQVGMGHYRSARWPASAHIRSGRHCQGKGGGLFVSFARRTNGAGSIVTLYLGQIQDT